MHSRDVLAIVKESEVYIFFYDDENIPALQEILGCFAGRPELSFTWHDAAVAIQSVKGFEQGASIFKDKAPNPFE